MTDLEFIKFLCEQIFNIVCDGDEPDLDKIYTELEKRNINPDHIFTC